MKFQMLIVSLVLLFVFSATVDAHFPVYSLYKERKPVDLFQALASARQAKRRAGGFEENYDLPFSSFYPRK
uniref:Neuropeptide-Like Protein n=2 Tax=Caenorhabditis tropicalis TaxID=1561998 RepID=A0A1I7TZK2_9PELO